MKTFNAFASSDNTETLVSELAFQLRESNCKLDALVGYFNVEHDVKVISKVLLDEFDCPIMLASSCNGAFGLFNGKGDVQADISVFGISDPNGHYGIGYAHTSLQAPQKAAEEAINSALESSGLMYETPTMVWTIMPPGQEEELLAGFANIIGPRVPIFGGSAADNDVSGNWYQFADSKIAQDLVIALVMQPSQPIASSYSSGYHPTEDILIASECEGRTVHKLNGIKAAVEYDALTNHSIAHALSGGNVLGDTTLNPLGKLISSPSGISEYLLCHPDSVTEEGGLSLFSVVENGQEFQLMEGSIEGLVNRAKMVIQNAIQLLPEGKKPTGVLMIYCAGCMLTVGPEIENMQIAVKELVGNLPVCGAYTFGEQGCFLDGKNRHGNLMISAVVFST